MQITVPDTIISPVISDAAFVALIIKLTEYGFTEPADQILGAIADGRTRREISSKLIEIINNTLAGEETLLLNAIFKVPDDFSLDTLDGSYFMGDDLAAEFYDLNSCWPKPIMPGTHAVGGYKLLHFAIKTNTNKPVWFLWLLITIYELDWTIMGVQTWQATEPIMDGEDIIGYELQVFMQLNSVVLLALNPRGVQTPDYSWLSGYSGMVPWMEPV